MFALSISERKVAHPAAGESGLVARREAGSDPSETFKSRPRPRLRLYPQSLRTAKWMGTKTDAQLGIEVRLPDDWQQRLVQEGGGGFDGSIRPVGNSDIALDTHSVQVATNGGHRDPSGNDFLNDSMKIQRYASRLLSRALRARSRLLTNRGHCVRRAESSHSRILRCSGVCSGALCPVLRDVRGR
jgi:hypothetical protein